ncbi:MAG: phosphoribosylformylglycinamidine synthase subunit PurS [Geminicoccaceae bacterium]|nr:phosphoribosylformylglycinamidine synthase subunit PurS [Geminicoccaceae bacterium]
MKALVTIRFKDGVLDPEAVAIGRALQGLGFAEVRSVRREKLIELDLETDDREHARARVGAMCEQLLANPVIESYRIELRDGGPAA